MLFVLRKTQTTGVTVSEVVPSSDPADATSVTVELSFIHIIKQFTLNAEVCGSEDSLTVTGPTLSTNLLSEMTDETDHLLHCPPLHCVT